MAKFYLLFLLISQILSIGVLKKSAVRNEKPLISFPGAEGYGCLASGGRGGVVAEVLNLNDSGNGSLRQAITSYPDKPLTIVFKVSGIIDLKSDLKINRSNLTIAGQTAPGDGICLKGRSLIINGSSGIKGRDHGNIVIRYIRSRPGGRLATGSYGIDIENAHDIIIDHCSFSWANEECAALYDVKNISFQWCIISEGLYDAGHAKGKRSYGGVWGGQQVSFHHNLIANQNSRTVRFNGARAHDTTALVDYRNNVIYNWGTENACYGGEVEIAGGSSKINLVNNYYLPGPATVFQLKFLKANYNANKAKGLGTWYLSGNTMQTDPALTTNNHKGIDLTEVPAVNQQEVISRYPFQIAEYARINTDPAPRALTAVLKKAGAAYPVRDAVDTRIISVITNGPDETRKNAKNGIIDSPEQVGGWPVYNLALSFNDSDHDGMPDDWEDKRKLNPKDPADRNFRNNTGYTMIEMYINSRVN